MNDFNELHALYHHGIKGQKWGVRRFQNDDGTLTAEGKARYGVDENGKMSKEGRELYNLDRKQALKTAKQDIKEHDLNVRMLSGNREDNLARYHAAKTFIAEKYGKQTMKDFQRSERTKEAIVGGTAFLASIGLLAASAAITISKVKKM